MNPRNFKQYLLAALGFASLACAMTFYSGSATGVAARYQFQRGQSAPVANSAPAQKPKGCFTCDFALPVDLPLNLVPAIIERDRMYMAERPGIRMSAPEIIRLKA
jgi:hypothetical protein